MGTITQNPPKHHWLDFGSLATHLIHEIDQLGGAGLPQLYTAPTHPD